MKCKIAIAILIVLMLLTSGLSCIQTTGSAPRVELAVLKQELVTDNVTGNVAVLVTVKNISNVKADLAEVKVRFYDSKKNLLDSERDSIINLKANETWDFTLTCQSDRCGEIKSYELETTVGSSSGGL
jgi:hypothetical protein